MEVSIVKYGGLSWQRKYHKRLRKNTTEVKRFSRRAITIIVQNAILKSLLKRVARFAKPNWIGRGSLSNPTDKPDKNNVDLVKSHISLWLFFLSQLLSFSKPHFHT
jgi:hypothetical protein